MDIRCDDVKMMLPWLVNSSLEGHDTVRVLDHVRHCPQCMEELFWLSALRTAVQTSFAAAPSEKFTDSLFKEINQQLEDTHEPAQPHDLWPSLLTNILPHKKVSASVSRGIFHIVEDSCVAPIRNVAERLRKPILTTMHIIANAR